MSIADEFAANVRQRQETADALAGLNAELFDLVRRGYSEKIPVPDLARMAGVTRGRIYQILRGE